MSSENKISPTINSEGENVSEIQLLASQAQDLQTSFDFWNDWYVRFVALTVFLAGVVFFTQFMSVKKGKALSQAQSELIKTKDKQLSIDLTDKDLKIAEAGERASKADEMAGKANERSATLEKRNLELQTNLERERTERLKLEAQIAPRRLSRDMQVTIAASLTPFAERSVMVKSYASDVESAVLGKQIINLLKMAHINVVENLLSQSSLGSIGFSVRVTGNDKDLTALLLKSLSSIGNLAVSPEAIPPGVMSIGRVDESKMDAIVFIGAKPITQ